MNRPPPMKRETIDVWIEYCPHCNYCSSDISDQKGVKRNDIRCTQLFLLYIF